MKKASIFAALLAAATVAAPASAANIVSNGDFSNGATGWVFSGFGIYNSNGGSAAATGCVGSGCTSTLGSGAFIRQTLSTVANATYQLSFLVGENAGPTSGLSVFWNGQNVLNQLNPANNTLTYNGLTDSYNGTYRLITVGNLLASSSSTNLEIHGRQDPAGLFLDNISVDTVTGAVPEPATWALMILGMGAVGFAMRRAKRNSDAKFEAKIKRITAGAIA